MDTSNSHIPTENDIQKLIDYMSQFITPERYQRFQTVVENRTRYITVVLEDIFQPHNASAVLRSCECFGIQNVHIIENQNEYMINPDIVLGSSSWLNLYKYNSLQHNTADCLQKLRQDGYRIVATSPHIHACSLDTFSLEKGKFALVYGTELNGLSEQVIKEADEFLYIPMHGFTESLNISVSVAVCLQYLCHFLRLSSVDWKLNLQERNSTLLQWLRNSLKNAEAIEKQFLSGKE